MPEPLLPDITVKALLDQHPQLLQTFLDLDLLCVGCPAEGFHTLADVAQEYGIDPELLIHRLRQGVLYAESENRLKP